MSALIMWNGEFVSSNKILSNQITVPFNTLDRAWNYGQGIFETIRVIDGQPQWLDLHLQRLQQGARTLFIPLIISQIDQEIRKVLDCISNQSGSLKIIISPIGVRRGYRITQGLHNQRCIQWFPFSNSIQPQLPARIILCDVRLANNQKLAGIKHSARLEYVMAFEEVKKASADEGIVLNSEEFIVEALQANIFWIKNNVLCTPSLKQAGVAGIMRKIILQAAHELDLKTEVAHFSLEDIWQSEYCFLSNTHYGLQQVCSLSISPQQISRLTKIPTTLIKKWSTQSENTIFSQLTNAVRCLG
ncbi:MAG: aminodeoxychorismate lyase [Pseudomonadota bacterium]